jgi:methionine-rich copper-binding protein CopC
MSLHVIITAEPNRLHPHLGSGSHDSISARQIHHFDKGTVMAANWSLNDVLAQLNSGTRWSGNTISYAFPSTSSGLFSQGEAAGFRAVNASQQSLMVLAMVTWDELMPQGFAPGTVGSTNIEFAYTSTNIGYAHAYFPTTGSVYFNATDNSLVNTAVGQYGFQTFIHEIGHALGLNHMGDYNGDGNWSPSSFQDSVVLSVMSYFGPRSAAPNYSAEVMQADWVGSDGRIHSPQTPMVNDVLAIQAIYGTSTTTRSGDTVYGFNSTAGGPTSQIYDFRANPFPVLTLFDSGGTDTLDLSGWASPSRVNLMPGAFSSGNDMTNNIAIAYSTTIENAIGGSGGDVLSGNAVANRLIGNGGNDELNGLDGDDVLDGGAGNDVLDGGAGTDTGIFGGNFASYTITVTGNTVTLVSAATGSDRAISIERFQFADGLRTLAELAGGTATDTTAPQLQSLSPVDNNTAVAVGANLIVSFNEPIKIGTGTLTVFNADGSVFRSIAITDATQISVNGQQATINPGIDLVAGRGYYVNWSAGAFTDLAGNPHAGLTGSTAWNFSTGSSDNTAPRVVSLTPADDAAQVTAGADLVLRFDEPVLAGSGNIVIRAGTQVLQTIAIGDTAQVSISGSTVTINPGADLPAGAAISVTVDAGALRDAAGNAYAGITTTSAWNFAVGASLVDDFPYATDTPGVVTVNGAPSTGVIEVGGDQDLFRVNLTAGVAYSFTLTRTAGGLSDPYLALWDGALQLRGEDDDSAGGGNARLGFTPDATGTYYLGVYDYLSTGSGAYTLTAATLDAQAPTLATHTPADDSTQVEVGADLVLGFSEAVLAGNGVIRLLTDAGTVLREIRADDSSAVHISGNTVTIDPGANLPADTAFSVVIDDRAFQDAAGNAFAGLQDLSAWNFRTAAVTAVDDFPMSISTPGVVAVNGGAVSGRIDFVNDGDLFRVTLAAGVTYRFDLASPVGSAVDPYLMLFGTRPEVDLIGYDDDGADIPLDSRLYFTPNTGGEYFLGAFDYAEATGSYRLSAATTTDDFLGAITTSGRVSIGASSSAGRIDVPSDIDMFAVSLTGGLQYTFDLKAAAAAGLDDPYLVLLDGNGHALAFDDDTGIDLEAALTYTAPASGTYFLAAMDYDSGTGGYALSGFVRNVLRGSATADEMVGTSGADTLEAGAGNDVMQGGAGDDILNGDEGIDTALFPGSIEDHYLEHLQTGGWVVRDFGGNGGRDLTYDVERLRFDDAFWAIDIDGHAGTTLKFIGAVFGADVIYNQVYVGIGLSLLDAGMDETSLMQLALDARLGANASKASIVNLLWSNLFGSVPDTPTRLYYEGLITDGSFTAATLGQAAAETEWNLQNIDLVGLADSGISYLP